MFVNESKTAVINTFQVTFWRIQSHDMISQSYSVNRLLVITLTSHKEFYLKKQSQKAMETLL